MTIDLRFKAFMSADLRAKLYAPKTAAPTPVRKTAQQRRLEAVENRLAKEAAAHEKAFQARVDAISDEMFVSFLPFERYVLDNTPILTAEQRHAYEIAAQFASSGKQARKKLRRELDDIKRRQRAGVLEA